MSLMKMIENKVIDPFHHICNQFFNNDVYMGGVTLSGVETLLFPPIHSPVITDPRLSSRNPLHRSHLYQTTSYETRHINVFVNSILSITFCLN